MKADEFPQNASSEVAESEFFEVFLRRMFLCLQEYFVNNYVMLHRYLNLLTLSSEKYDLFVETFSVREYVVNTDAVYPELFADICPLPQC